MLVRPVHTVKADVVDHAVVVFTRFFDLVERVGAKFQAVITARDAAHLDVLIPDVPVVDISPSGVDTLAELIGGAVGGTRKQAVGCLVFPGTVTLLIRHHHGRPLVVRRGYRRAAEYSGRAG